MARSGRLRFTLDLSIYTIGGSASGLAGKGLVRDLNGGAETLPIGDDGPFEFTTEVAQSSAYTVTVASHPVGQFCSVSNASGKVSGSDVTDIVVTCRDARVFDDRFELD